MEVIAGVIGGFGIGVIVGKILLARSVLKFLKESQSDGKTLDVVIDELEE